MSDSLWPLWEIIEEAACWCGHLEESEHEVVGMRAPCTHEGCECTDFVLHPDYELDES